MLLAAAVLLLPVDFTEIDKLAQARDFEGMVRHAAPGLVAGANPFRFLRTGGAYGGGRFGWNAVRLEDAAGGGEFVVFTTKITGEDIGAQVFRVEAGKIAAKVPELDTFGAKITHHDFEIWFQPEEKRVRIVDKLDLELDGRAKSFQMRLSPHYVVSAVSFEGGGAAEFRQAGGVVSVAASKGPHRLVMEYGGLVDLPQYAASIGPREATLTNDFWWPQIARAPATYTATIHAPRAWTTIAQGELVATKDDGESRATTFRMTLPTSVFSLSSGPYRSASKTIDGRPYTMLSTEQSEDAMLMQAELNAPVIDFYSRTFSPYPFTRWKTLESRIYGGGALEAYSFATYGTGWLPDEDAHEPAHTWWGGVIPNTYLRSFWNESFAVYSDGLYGREGGPKAFDEKHRDERRRAFVASAQPQPAYRNATCADASCEIGGVASALGYGKGAAVLQMLEAELGTPAMIDTCRRWIADHPRGTAGEWEGYEAAVSKSTGKDYKWFFDQWLRRTGWPEFDVKDVRWEGGKLRGRFVFEGEPYRLRVETILEFPDGSREWRAVQTSGSASSEFTIDSDKRPSLVSFDPWMRLLRRTDGDEWPTSLSRVNLPAWVESGRDSWSRLTRRRGQRERPKEAAGTMWIAHPETDATARMLCEMAGFQVRGDTLTYDGTTIDLRRGAALAVVDLPEGQAVIALGATRLRPNTGRARLALVDELGRVLRAKTDPKSRGFLTARL